MEKSSQSLEALRSVIKTLIGPDGCPWDKEQTPVSLCDYVIEEAFELVEAIRSGNMKEAREEIGDVMFLLLFIAELYEKDGQFSLSDSLEESAAKMIRRHPHVFADLKVENQEELLRNWEKIKRNEKKDEEGRPARLFDSLPKGLPPLLRAYRINSKAARVGFTWESDEDVETQLGSEWLEFQEALEFGDKKSQEEEFGDYLFTVAEYGRRKGIKANAALDFANQKFLTRFNKMEELALERGKKLDDMSFDEMNDLWDEIKD